MVTGTEALQSVHDTSLRLFDERTAAWADGKAVNVFEELKFTLYDIMGEVLFGGAWSENDNGPTILKLHRYRISLLSASARVGLGECWWLQVPDRRVGTAWHPCTDRAHDEKHTWCGLRLQAISEGYHGHPVYLLQHDRWTAQAGQRRPG